MCFCFGIVGFYFGDFAGLGFRVISEFCCFALRFLLFGIVNAWGWYKP